MNLPNKLTCLRVIMIVPFVILALMQSTSAQIAAAVIYVLACVTDLLDGYIARSRNLITNFGKFMDPIADKLLVMSAMIVLVSDGRILPWACIVILGREFIVSGFRLVAAERGIVIAAALTGKLKTVFQMVATLALLLLGRAWYTDLLFGIAVGLTVISGAEYVWKNREVLRG